MAEAILTSGPFPLPGSIPDYVKTYTITYGYNINANTPSQYVILNQILDSLDFEKFIGVELELANEKDCILTNPSYNGYTTYFVAQNCTIMLIPSSHATSVLTIGGGISQDIGSGISYKFDTRDTFYFRATGDESIVLQYMVTANTRCPNNIICTQQGIAKLTLTLFR